MRLLCLSDIHGASAPFEKILRREPEPDALLIGGDFTNFGPPQEAERLLDTALLYCPQVFAVAGNCDSPEIDEMLLRRGVSLHRRGHAFNGFGFFGLSAMPPWRGDMYEFTEEKLHGFLAEGHAQAQGLPRFIMLTHPPPHQTQVDRNASGKHLGSTAVRKWMDDVKPALIICGHIHEARGVDEINGTVIVNCGPVRNGYFAVVDVAEKITVELRQV